MALLFVVLIGTERSLLFGTPPQLRYGNHIPVRETSDLWQLGRSRPRTGRSSLDWDDAVRHGGVRRRVLGTSVRCSNLTVATATNPPACYSYSTVVEVKNVLRMKAVPELTVGANERTYVYC